MSTFKANLVSPEKLLFSDEVDQVDLPGLEGDFGVLAGLRRSLQRYARGS
jgi:F-type H+-transporting ATPase subunit epsilon